MAGRHDIKIRLLQPLTENLRQFQDQMDPHRTAAGVFFELLQLKTWDFIEVDQDEAYGTIAISAGLRFGEDAPNN